MPRRPELSMESLEDRSVPAVVTQLTDGTLTVSGDDADNRIDVFKDGNAVVVRERGVEVSRSAGVNAIVVNGGNGDDIVKVSTELTQATTINGGAGINKLRGGGGATTLFGGPVADTLVGGLGANTVTARGNSRVYRLLQAQLAPGSQTAILMDGSRALGEGTPKPRLGALGIKQATLTADEVDNLLRRASAVSRTQDAIIAVVDRNGRILGVRVEDGVSPEILNNPALLAFAVDGAVAKARTGAFFASNQAPLTSRTIQNLSETTVTEREVNSNPSDTNPNSPNRGPGTVAAVGTKGHFPNGIVNTPQVDLFGIEYTNRDGTFHVGPDGIKGTADDVRLRGRFNIDPQFVPTGNDLFPLDSYGFESNTNRGAQSRGLGTLPGGVPIFKANSDIQPFGAEVVGGIGVFFPGRTGFATEENSELSSTFDPTKPDRSLEAEMIAVAAVGGAVGGKDNIFRPLDPIKDARNFAGIPLAPNLVPLLITDDFQRIDLVGLNLDIVGRNGTAKGIENVAGVFGALNDGLNSRVSGRNLVVDLDGDDNTVGTADDRNAADPLATLRPGVAVPEGWLVMPHDGVGITAAEVTDIITNGLAQAYKTRAAIRLPLGSFSVMVLAVSDRDGNVVGLYRMPDSTIFSIDVAVAKSRNVAYHADPTQVDPRDLPDGVAAGTAFTNRTFRYLALPRFPESVDLNSVPGQFSQLNDAAFDPVTGRQLSPTPIPASAFQSVFGRDVYNPGTNFRQTRNTLNQNGIVFFPGSAPLYRADGTLIGGFGISGDGVDQDDVVTGGGQKNFTVPGSVLRADQVTTRGIRLPYQKHNRNPEG